MRNETGQNKKKPSSLVARGFLLSLAGTAAAEAVAVGEDHTEDDNNRDCAPNVSDNFLRAFVKKEAHIFNATILPYARVLPKALLADDPTFTRCSRTRVLALSRDGSNRLWTLYHPTRNDCERGGSPNET